ncbi:MBOAT family protein [Mucilaginibacter terrenus]|uniref:MBOAT family protein n=1 Tax=Mucilaginibacter terrenus TaxID=2482727 RepID=A0A3E2NMC0_9SPHI|nr:MBOAT family O-acyltransferase [Mucilaginibacter terrenus]RFZ82093.1 MBOAT family protein [Mucilaginibacter terrenus]
MLFNSQAFAAFFIIVFTLYWFVFKASGRLQNVVLLTASYAFYCYWDWRLLWLLIFSTALHYTLGYYVGNTEDPKKRRLFVNLGIITSIGLLAYFKYANFFVSSFLSLFSGFNSKWSTHTLNIILPLGISFYTFRLLSYLFDVNKRKIQPTTDWLSFFTFAAFFPSLVSGPIDKAGFLLPQLQKKRVFEEGMATDGLRQILWGLFKKTVVADNCALITDSVFAKYHTLPASSIIISLFLYTIQIYADFSGYSDMAMGLAKLLGINITRNFDYPFFSQNIGEFWRKWHISLTTWLTEYVFTPLNIWLRDYDKAGIILAILINFTLIGIWHGPNWTFVLFGFLHGCFYIPLILKGSFNKKKKLTKGRLLPTFKEFVSMLGTFILVMLSFVLFRSESVAQAGDIYRSLFSASLFTSPVFDKMNLVQHTFIFIGYLLVLEWLGKDGEHALSKLVPRWPAPVRWAFYYGSLVLIFLFAGLAQNFIYFQF